MINTFIFLFFVVPIIGIIYNLWSKNRKRKQFFKEGRALADTDIVTMPYRGEHITMTYIDYLNNWQYMSRESKNQLLSSQKKRIEKGEVKKVFQEDGSYYIVASDKGKHLRKIHLNKDKIYRENGSNKG